jgi:hypothetical protein
MGLVVSKFDPRWSKFLNDQQKKGCFNREFKIIPKYSEKQKDSFWERSGWRESIPYHTNSSVSLFGNFNLTHLSA